MMRNQKDVFSWEPANWDEIVGNRQAKSFLKHTSYRLRKVLQQDAFVQFPSPRILLTGPSRSGKTAMVKMFCRYLICNNFDWETFTPCNFTCEACQRRLHLYGDEGLFRQDRATLQLHLFVLDCTKIKSPSELIEHLNNRSGAGPGGALYMFYLDEVHRLVRKSMDEILLKEMEDTSRLWILSTAKPENLEDMLLNRVLKFSTELPTEQELTAWLERRCETWDISWEPEAIRRVVEKSQCVPGTALHALAIAAIDPETGLTLDLVENWWNVDL